MGIVEYVCYSNRVANSYSNADTTMSTLSGCFVCIRCSGIHRSMGTHISKVKSVDLDTWTPEQMDVSPCLLYLCGILLMCPLTFVFCPAVVDPAVGKPSRQFVLGGRLETGSRT
jgi:hypothetical protein